MSIHTLKHLTTRWPNFSFASINTPNIRSAGTLKVGASKSGSAMVFLEGIEVKIGDAWVDAHLSFPPDDSGTGTFTEGHLKIEGGKFLNQYFFSCDDDETWEVEQLANSKSVKTAKPGKWRDLPTSLWSDVDTLATYLAYL